MDLKSRSLDLASSQSNSVGAWDDNNWGNCFADLAGPRARCEDTNAALKRRSSTNSGQFSRTRVYALHRPRWKAFSLSDT